MCNRNMAIGKSLQEKIKLILWPFGVIPVPHGWFADVSSLGLIGELEQERGLDYPLWVLLMLRWS